MSKKVSRSFYYYDIELFNHNCVTNTVGPVADFKKTATDIFTKINTLDHLDAFPYDDNTLIYKTQSGDFLFVLVDKIGEETIEIRLVLSRKNELPYVDKNGELKPLIEFLPSMDAGLAEITHLVIFTEYGVVGAEYNYYGPRPSAISYYIQNKYPDIVKVDMDPKVNKDVLQKLRDEAELSLFSLKVKPHSRLLAEIMNTEQLLTATDPDLNIDDVQIVMKRRITKKKSGFKNPFSKQRLSEALTSNEREEIDGLIIKEKIHADYIDLLSDKLVFKKSLVPIENSRTIKKEDAYNIITQNFNETVVNYSTKKVRNNI